MSPPCRPGLPPGPCRVGPARRESLSAQVRSRRRIRCQRGGQTPPVGGAHTTLTPFQPSAPPSRRAALPRASWAPERGRLRRRLKGAPPALGGEPGSGSHLDLAGSGREAEVTRGGKPNLPDCAAPRAATAARQRQRQSERGRGRARRGFMEVPGRRRRCPSLARSLPPRLRATDGAAGGMTGNSWARTAESKYEQRRRAREDRGAHPLPGPRRPPTPHSCSNPPPPQSPQGRRPPSAPGRIPSAWEHPFPMLGPKSRAAHPTHPSHLSPLKG